LGGFNLAISRFELHRNEILWIENVIFKLPLSAQKFQKELSKCFIFAINDLCLR